MQTLYAIHVNNVGQVSVDVFSEKHSGAAKWRVYFAVGPLSVQRLRRIYAKHPKAFYISREWSAARWRVYKEWSTEWTKPDRRVRGASLDYLVTNSEGPKL